MEKALRENLHAIDSLSTSTKPIPVPPRAVPIFEGSSCAVDAPSPTVANLRASAFTPSIASPSFFNASPLRPCDSALSAGGRPTPLPALKTV